MIKTFYSYFSIYLPLICPQFFFSFHFITSTFLFPFPMSLSSFPLSLPSVLYSLLLNCSSPEPIAAFLLDSFRFRHSSSLPPHRLSYYSDQFKCSDLTQLSSLSSSVTSLILSAVYHQFNSKEALSTLFPQDFHPQLKALLIKLILPNLFAWSELVTTSVVSPAKLLDSEYRLELKASSSSVASMSIPSVVVSLAVQDAPKKSDTVGDIRTIEFEMSKQNLETMVNGLEKIREQLAGMQ